MSPLYNMTPLTTEDLKDPAPFEIPADELQLQVDVLNVCYGQVLLSSFPPEYQTKIKHYYRFFGIRSWTKNPTRIRKMKNTGDLI